MVVADKDKIVPVAYGDVVAERIPGSRLHVIGEAGHMVILERPDEFADLVVDFLAD